MKPLLICLIAFMGCIGNIQAQSGQEALHMQSKSKPTPSGDHGGYTTAVNGYQFELLRKGADVLVFLTKDGAALNFEPVANIKLTAVNGQVKTLQDIPCMDGFFRIAGGKDFLGAAVSVETVINGQKLTSSWPVAK